MKKLTKTIVDALKPSKVEVEGSKHRFVWDGELRGFGVRLSPAGRRSFIVQYRTPEGKNRRTVIGHYGLMTVEQARDRAFDILVTVSKGIDPAIPTEPEGSKATIAEICDWYLAEAKAGRIVGRRRRPIKPSTLKMDESRITVHIKPLLGDRTIDGLKLGDIEGMQADIAAGKTAKARASSRGGAATGGAGVAARTISSLHSILEHAVRLGRIPSNPAKGVRKLAGNARERRLSRSEIVKFGAAMRQAEADGEHPTGLAAIRLLLLTGFRRMEGLGLQRPWLDSEEGAIRFPDTKSDRQIRAIGRAAVDLLLAQPTVDKSPFFFPADWGDGHFIGVVRVLDRVCALARLEDVTPHTLRHTFGSVAGDLGFSELTIRPLLGHAPRGITQRYVHLDVALKLAADTTAREIANLLAGRGVKARGKRAAMSESNADAIAAA